MKPSLWIPAMALCAAYVAAAGTHATVTIDTSGLVNRGNGPFTLDLQFVEGDGAGDSNNMVTLSDFSLGGGSIATPAISMTGGVTVSASPLTVVLVDSSFFQDVQLTFTPGNALTFQIDSTSNPDAVAPDTFTMAILDGTGNEIPTNNPNGLDSFVEVDLPTMAGGTQVTASDDTGGNISSSATVVPSCDVNGNATASAADVQALINQSLGVSAAANDLNGDGAIDVTDIQLVINAVLGQGCPVS
ncbi:MAG TPA: dockerin type I domain-containing protein [Bryobacteraceae bacterium]|jgi:hypothetical protein|nr:dockerin type I domain-containing protein [Bryobacteraceae bacterium]